MRKFELFEDGGLRIAVDNERLAQMLGAFLREKGYRVVSVGKNNWNDNANFGGYLYVLNGPNGFGTSEIDALKELVTYHTVALNWVEVIDFGRQHKSELLSYLNDGDLEAPIRISPDRY